MKTDLGLLDKLFTLHYNDSYIKQLMNTSVSTNMFILEHADSEDFDVSKLTGINVEGRRSICRVHTNKRQGYFFIKNNFKTFSIYHACNSSWSYNIPEDYNEYCFKCKIKPPNILFYNRRY